MKHFARRRFYQRAVVGDYRESGSQLSGYSTVGAFRKNGTGFSPTGSYSPELLGIAADWHFGAWSLSAAYSWTGNRPIVHLGRSWRSVTAGLTATSEAASAEARISLPGWSLFGEAACTWRGQPSVLAGSVHVPAYGRKLGLLARWYGPSDRRYSGLAAGYESPSFSITADAGWRSDTGAAQYKGVLQWKPAFQAGNVALQPLLYLSARYRPADDAPLRARGGKRRGGQLFDPFLLAHGGVGEVDGRR